jgi:hypothetical protein
MKKILLMGLVLFGFACGKSKTSEKTTDPPGEKQRCGIILEIPVLDSFVYPNYYITTIVKFPEGNETVHYKGEVTGDHDGSWFLPRYDKDSSICITVPQ